jgi:hypothetical protein
MTDLSPAGQAVLNAALDADFCIEFTDLDATVEASVRSAVAAALRAAADQVVPEEPELNPLEAWSVEDWNYMNITKYQREECRRNLLTIAAELEGKANA